MMPIDVPNTPQPQLELGILDAPQKRLWEELGATPEQFTLYGGTALALQLGHRRSVDFDFFSALPFDPQQLLTSLPYLHGARVTQMTTGGLTVSVDRGGGVKVSFFAPPQPLLQIGNTVAIKHPRLSLASKIDIAATKLAVLAMRPAAKDYIDIHALLTKGNIPLEIQLAAVPFVFSDNHYNPIIPLKALGYFGDGDLQSLPDDVKRDLITAVAAVDIANVERRMALARANPNIWKELP